MATLLYAIIGTGAVGGYYGALLQRAGCDVHFLLHSDYEHVRRHGLRIDSKNGNFKLPKVHAYRRACDLPRCDVAIVALKATANRLLPDILPRAVKPGGTIVLLQNGFGAEATVARVAPGREVIGGMSFICSNKIGPGHIRHLDYGLVTLAPYCRTGRGRITARMRRIARDLERAGVPVTLFNDLVLARWKKLVWNIPFNGLSVVLDMDTRALMRNPEVRRLSLNLMNETVAGAAALGQKIPPTFVRKMMTHTEKMKPYKTSMKLDYDHKRPMELEAIYGEPLRAAAKKSVSLPTIQMLYNLLKFMDINNRKGA